MMWYSGNDWGWCALIVNVLAMELFWGAAFTAIALAVHFLAGNEVIRRPWRWAVPPGPAASRPHSVRALKSTTKNFTTDWC